MKKLKIIFCIIFLTIIYFFFFTTINNNNPISTLEGRTLTTFPKFNINNLTNKDYFDELTNAFSDQLELRNYLIKGYYLFQFQRYNGDVVIGDNNELYASVQTINKNYYNNLKEDVLLINELGEELNSLNTKMIFLPIPRKDAVMTDNLPKSYISSNTIYKKSIEVVKENLNNNIYLIDSLEILKNVDKPYYSNDHHLTPKGAFSLYKEIIDYINKDEAKYYGIDNYIVKNKIINGSFSRQLGQSTKTKAEELVLLPKYNLEYTRYENEKISKKEIFKDGNTYSLAFMDGDNALTVIDTKRNNLPNIMYVGSSYTNILESISVISFNKMVSIDYRHNKSNKSISDYVKEYNIDYVVFMPSQSTSAFPISKIKVHLGLEKDTEL